VVAALMDRPADGFIMARRVACLLDGTLLLGVDGHGWWSHLDAPHCIFCSWRILDELQ
jgi:hypothetical protein